MSSYPISMEEFQNVILNLQGIHSIESGVDNLEGIDCSDLTLANYAHLPHGALLRTQGGLKGEVLCQFEFFIDKSLAGLSALEFFAWFVRDQARSGEKIQLRPFALPPVTPNGRQLGTTLRFHIDLFQDQIEGSLDPLFALLAKITASLVLAIEQYDIPTKAE